MGGALALRTAEMSDEELDALQTRHLGLPPTMEWWNAALPFAGRPVDDRRSMPDD
jgi:hypothetical protein